MKKHYTILFLLLMGIIIFPWETICLAHPLGHSHEHHSPNKPSSCELHRMAANQPGNHILPPMECNHKFFNSDKFQQPQPEIVAPSFQVFAILTVVFELPNSFSTKKISFLFPPDPKCRSATLISDNPLRGSPLV